MHMIVLYVEAGMVVVPVWYCTELFDFRELFAFWRNGTFVTMTAKLLLVALFLPHGPHDPHGVEWTVDLYGMHGAAFVLVRNIIMIQIIM